MTRLPLFAFLLLLVSCSSAEDAERKLLRKHNRVGSGVFRTHDERVLSSPKLEYAPSPTYSWRKQHDAHLPEISIEHFRCKGNPLNPSISIEEGSGDRILQDCQGGYRHSLPLKKGKEFIYPILLEILNKLQSTFQKKIIILSGHRCPEHNTYIDNSRYNSTSKHTIGAEVAFYIEGINNFDEVVQEIIELYKEDPRGSAFQNFSRYTKPDTNVSTPPWMNKEIFIKIFQSNEGRNRIISNNTPYLSIQVRYDRDSDERVTYSWDKAYKNFYRW